MSVLDTIALSNGTMESANFWPVNMFLPASVAAPPGSDKVLVVANGGAGLPTGVGAGLEVFNASSESLIGGYATGVEPEGIAIDSAASEAFIANSGSNSVTIFNYATDSVQATISSWFNPAAVAYVAPTDQLFIANSGSENVSVVDLSNFTLAASVPVGIDPDALAYDPADAEVFVVDANWSYGLAPTNVSVIDVAHDSVTKTLTLGAIVSAIAYDPADGDVYVANEQNTVYGGAYSNITIVNGTTDLVEGNLTAGDEATGLAVGPSPGDLLYVSNWASQNLSVINVTTGIPTESIPLSVTPEFDGPTAIAVNAGDGTLYAADANADNVTIVNTTTGRATGTLTVGTDPVGLVYDARQAEIQVAEDAPERVAEMSTVTQEITGELTVPFLDPGAIAYDPVDDATYLTNYWDAPTGPVATSPLVASINDSTGAVKVVAPVGQYADAEVYDSGRGEMFIANLGSDSVTVLNTTSNTVVTTIPVGSEPVALAYDPAAGEVFVVNFLTNNVSVISDSENQVTATFSGMDGPSDIAYASTEGDLVITNAYSDNLTVLNATSGDRVGLVSVGFSAYAVMFDPLDGEVYVTNLQSDTVISISASDWTVLGSVEVGDEPIALALDPVTGDIYVANWLSGSVSVLSPGGIDRFPVEFEMSGLPTGTLWGATFDGGLALTDSSVIDFSAAVGSYAYNVSPVVTGAGQEFVPTVSSGIVSVSSGETSVVTVQFSLEGYRIDFSEVGLPLGSAWSVSLSGAPLGPTVGNLTYFDPNGTFLYVVVAVPGFQATPGSGDVVVQGAEVNVTISFAAVSPPTMRYPVDFLESGLSPNTVWWINVSNGGSNSSSLSLLSIDEANGSYDYVASAIGYGSVVGNFSVRGPASPGYAVQLNFSRLVSTGLAPASPASLSTLVEISAAAAGVAVGVIGTVLFLRYRSRSR